MEFIIVFVLLGLWLYGLKIRNDMHKHSRSGALEALRDHDPAALLAPGSRRNRADGSASPHPS